MITFDHIPMGESGLNAFYKWLDNYVFENESIAYKKYLSKPSDVCKVPAIFITNRKISDIDKQIALITLGRHGQELGTRVVGAKIMQYLASDEANIIRNTQLIIVIPVLNPEGFIKNDFNSSMTSITKHEQEILGNLFSSILPDMILDIHSLGKIEGSKYDHGDMEVIIPANTTRWAMDEQIHQYVAQKMKEEAESNGWPYEIHTLEDLSLYYFGATEIGNLPWRPLDKKVFLLQMLNSQDNYEFPERAAYTNYTCAPAYSNWHCLVFGMETNHWSLKNAHDIAVSGMVPSVALLKMGSMKLPWEKDIGYPVNILQGDFRISLRPVGESAAARRLSRIKLWKERKFFSIPCRELQDENTTLAQVNYFGKNLPLEFAFCLRMRQDKIKDVYINKKSVKFESFKDNCSIYLYIPIRMQKSGKIEIVIEHLSF